MGESPFKFPKFTSLPQEIQDYIWDLAIRPLPGSRHVHEFYIVDHYFKKATRVIAPAQPAHKDQPAVPAKKLEADFLRFEAGGYLNSAGCSWGLAVPHETSSRGRNTSAYMTDTGLWTACGDSRRALERYFDRNEWWSDIPGAETPRGVGANGFAGQRGVSHSASYIRGDGRVGHVTISVERDLVHLVKGFAYADWHYHYAGDRYLIKRNEQEGEEQLFLGANVALTFDPAWTVYTPAYLEDMLEVLHDETERIIWFIDYRLRRREAAVASEQARLVDREVFYSWGQRFTEVKEEDKPLWEIDDEDTKTQWAFDFFHTGGMHPPGRVVFEGSDRVRLLAWEKKP